MTHLSLILRHVIVETLSLTTKSVKNLMQIPNAFVIYIRFFRLKIHKRLRSDVFQKILSKSNCVSRPLRKACYFRYHVRVICVVSVNIKEV